MRKKKLFIFDLDGTLADCYRAIEDSLNYALKKLGYKTVSYYRVKKAVGHGDRNFIKQFFKKKDVSSALEIYRSHHLKSILRYSRLYPYSKKLLSFLKKKNKIVAIASNRPRQYTGRIVEKLRIDKYIDFVLCADEIKKLKPHPKLLHTIMDKYNIKKKDTVYVGDMDIDLEAAKRAGLSAIFISGGSSALSDIRKYKNKTIVHSLKEIIDVLS
jgi:phosphoglycolate phosphatase